MVDSVSSVAIFSGHKTTLINSFHYCYCFSNVVILNVNVEKSAEKNSTKDKRVKKIQHPHIIYLHRLYVCVLIMPWLKWFCWMGYTHLHPPSGPCMRSEETYYGTTTHFTPIHPVRPFRPFRPFDIIYFGIPIQKSIRS